MCALLLFSVREADGQAARPSVIEPHGQPLAAGYLPGGSIHGFVLADTPAAFGATRIGIPDATVTVKAGAGQDARTTAQVKTNDSGGFQTPVQPSGAYAVCVAAKGFLQTCVPGKVTVGKATLFLREPRRLRSSGVPLRGQVTLQDGSPPTRAEADTGSAAGPAEVSLLGEHGELMSGPAPIDAGGYYILPDVSPGKALSISARFGQARVTQVISLSAHDIADGKPVDLVLPARAPVIGKVTMTLDGKPVAAAPPGSTVEIAVSVRGDDAAPLRYRWSTASGGLVAANAPRVTWHLPKSAAANVLLCEISNDQGGVSRFSVTIPAAVDKAAPEAGTNPELDFKQIGGPPARAGVRPEPGAQGKRIAGSILLPGFHRNPPLPPFHYIPPHQGKFIDPVAMMSSACSSEADCEIEAGKYYQRIGAENPDGSPSPFFGTFKAWKTSFGFGYNPLDPASGELRAVYYNNADLGFGRDMHCRIYGQSVWGIGIACYVSNYGSGTTTFGADPQQATANAAANTGRIATVTMTYLKRTQPPLIDEIDFQVFGGSLNGDDNDGPLLTSALLDGEKQKAVPGVCIACHGGGYDGAAHIVNGTNFLPFDVPSFIFNNSIASISEAAQRDVFRTFNSYVKQAATRATIPQLIDGWYAWCGGVGTAGCDIDDAGHPYYPNQACVNNPGDPGDVTQNQSCGWPASWGGIPAAGFYQQVPRVYCRTCHVAQSNLLNVDSFPDWTGQESLIQSYVFGSTATPPVENFMPFAQVPYDAFWTNAAARTAALNFLAVPVTGQ